MSFSSKNDENRVSVKFFSPESSSRMVDRVSVLKDPIIVLWFVGTRGLKLQCLEYYKNKIIDPIIQKQPLASFVLVDLSAWGAFRDSNISIQTSSHLADFINEKFFPKFRCFKSSDFFRSLSLLDNESLIKSLKASVSRIFLNNRDFEINPAGFKTGAILPENCSVFKEWLNCDASLSYSPLQYLEAMFIIEWIINSNIHKSNLQIVFALPNDELKYYLNTNSFFEGDLNLFLKSRTSSDLLSNPTDVFFHSFNYGEKKSHRPYNYPGAVFKIKDVKNGKDFL